MLIKEEKFIKIKNIIGVLFLISIFLIAIQVASGAEITTYKWGSGGDVTKNNLIKKNIPNSQIVMDVIKAAKKGTPVIKFGDGDGPTTLIVAGVHGNELSSQVAAIRLINNLYKFEKEKPIKGTIYIIPFVAPKSTASNVRFFNVKNLNSVANNSGTLTNNIIKFAKNKKIEGVGDFHSTQPGGVPGKNFILGTDNPTIESAKMAKAISKLTGHPYKNEYLAAKSYPGALEDNLNLNGIPAVTCEVKSPHGKIASGSVLASYNQMKAFLKYSKNI
ncbi:MAG: succinylglutamate desuccinylase/aspartoacylase family protein [Methanobacteriaceae archaeon]|nr:succinylglutamate desuccinylase/aspartoacylase family protein [Candidatus Methanorudis spinitermitis]